MNKARRIRITEITEKLSEIRDLIEDVKNEEEEYKDNIPENMQGGKRYEIAENACLVLEEALDDIDSALGNLEIATE